MGLFDRFRGNRGTQLSGNESAATLQYLRAWVAGHSGVEAFIEPRTTVTELTVVLVAGDGEWTRRRVGGEKGARRLSGQLHIPVYDVQKVGYPQRMRDFDARRRIERRRAERRDDAERGTSDEEERRNSAERRDDAERGTSDEDERRNSAEREELEER